MIESYFNLIDCLMSLLKILCFEMNGKPRQGIP